MKKFHFNSSLLVILKSISFTSINAMCLKSCFNVFLLLLISVNTALADDNRPNNSVLHGLEFIAPEGRWAVRVELRSNGYDSLYDSDGNKQALGKPFDNVDLDGSVFPDLAVFGPSASLGTTSFSAEVSTKRVELTLAYGISADLTVGVIIPYGKVKTSATFNVNGGNIGFNPAFDPSLPPGPANPPLLPVGSGPTEPVGTAGVQQIISDPTFGLAYKPLNTTDWQGIGDPTVGVLWRFYKSSTDSLIFGTGIRFGIAKDINPDDLLQVAIDDGSTDYRARLEYYRDLGSNFDLKLVGEYTYQFEDSVTRRVPTSGQLLATADSKETLDRKLGNYREVDIGLGKVIDDWRFSATWHRYQKSADNYSSSVGSDTGALELNTGLYANQWRASVSWSGIGAWQRGDLPLPLIIQLEVQDTYAAKNFPDVRDVYLQLTSFF